MHLKTVLTKKIRKLLTLILLFITLITCIDPFQPNLKGTSLLIVDALLTNENKSYAFKLSWTTQTQNTEPVIASDARVTIRDKNGISTNLTETVAGIYKTDSLDFLGETGNSYVLEIRTAQGTEYVSDVPNPKLYDYFNADDIRPVEQIRQVCYAFDSSDEITIKSTASTSGNKIEKQPILFIASDQSDRLLIQYYIEIKQLSHSKREFEFWNQMKEINEGRADIFEKQPYSVTGNIHNKNNPSELVLGYFQVSAVEPKSIYITPDELAELNLPEYQYECGRVEVGHDDYPGVKMTFDNIYASYSGSYAFIEPIYDLRWNLIKLVFAKRFCAFCTNSGTLTRPDFWVDL